MKNDIKDIFRNLRRLSGEDEGRFEMCRRSLERMKSILGLYPKTQKKKEGLGKLLRG